MNVVIIEDEVAAYDNIRHILLETDPKINILAHLDSVEDSVSWFQANAMPDLLFMDIQLADGLSFNIFDCVNIDVPVIFTTAYDQYAIRAFQVNSVDYLLKPITFENVGKALDKYRRYNPEQAERDKSNIERMIQSVTGYSKRVLVPYKDRILPIKAESIAYFYNTNGESRLTTLEGTTYPLAKSLDALMKKLDPNLFFRANRQFLISREAVESLTVWFDSRLRVNLLLPVPEPIYVAKNRASDFKSWLSES